MRILQQNCLRCAALLRLLPALLLACGLLGTAHPVAAAGTYTVTSTLDDGSDGTLRSVLALANGDPGATIVFGPGVAGVIALQGAELDITASMTILGPGAGVVQVDGGGGFRLFNITSPSAQVGISGLTLRNGSAFNDPNAVTSGTGGGISNDGTLLLTGCALSGNSAFAGGGVYNAGTLLLTGCTLTGNSAFFAGGLYSSGTTTLTACTVSANSAFAAASGNSGSGAGLYNDGGLMLAACVISGNTAYGGTADNGGSGGVGGGLYSAGTLTMTGCTVSGNRATPNIGSRSDGTGATGFGGGLGNEGTATLTDDIFYADTAAFGAEIANDTAGSAAATVTAAFCDIQGSSAAPGSFGPNNLDVDPLFVRPVNTVAMPPDLGSLHLQAASPCLGAGFADPADTADRDGNSRPDPPSIGVYEHALGPPAATPQSITTQQNTPVAITLAGSDPNLLPLTYRVASDPTHGTLSGTAPALLYTPTAGYLGADSFTFMVSNGSLESAAAVSLTVIPAHAVNVSDQVSISFGGFSYRRATQTFAQQLTLTNVGTTPVQGPVTLALDQLSRNARLVNATGVTAATLPEGSPTLVASPGVLAPGASVLVNLSFSDLNFRRITYAARVLSGTGD